MKSVITKLLILILIACSSPSFAAVKTVRVNGEDYVRLAPLYDQIFKFGFNTNKYMFVRITDLYGMRTDFIYYQIYSLRPYYGLSSVTMNIFNDIFYNDTRSRRLIVK